MSVEYTYEITLIDPLTDHEYAWIEEVMGREGDECAVNHNGRILLIETEDEINEVISLLARLELADDVGMIRQIVEYVPERNMIEIEFTPEFDLGKD